MSSVPGISVVSQMLEFYGLQEHPFGVSPDPRFLYPSFQHREAMASLIFGIESQVGFAALIAEPGAGKTTLLFDILQRYRDRASTAFVFNTQCSGPELLRQVVAELQVPGAENERDALRLHQLFTEFVADHLRNKPVVIVIDEAQNLENSALETLRLLSNFEAADRKLLHIILAGQPQLASKLRHPSLTQLLQRITTVSRLERFSPAQMEECIAFRLRVAGFTGSALFSDEAMAKVKAASGGVPREINRICINAMQLGFALRQRPIGPEVIDEVMADLTLAKWIPEAELPAIEPEAPKASSSSVGFWAGAQSSPRSVPSPGPLPAAVPQGAANISSRPVEALSMNPLVGTWNSPLAAPESELRRVLLGAAVQRKRAAELRLLGLRHKESQTSASSQPLYPYKFAMGCVPCPAGAEQDAFEYTEPSGSPMDQAGEVSPLGEGAQREQQDKKTGT
jgi:type II secretory pathway predicted ATPase ExeA